MKITIYMGPWLPVPAVEGGAVNRLWQGVAEEFVRQGHEVTFLCRTHPQQPNQEIINGVNYLRKGGLSQSPNIYFDLVKDFYSAITTFPYLPKADILVINDFWMPVFASLRPQCGKIIINVARFPKGQYWLYGATDFFVPVSNSVAQEILAQYPAASNRLTVIPNPIDTTVFFPLANKPPSPDVKTILYVGRLHPEKGVELLLLAFKLLCTKQDKIKLKIVGPWQESQGGGGENYWKKLQTLAHDLPVEFTGAVFDLTELVKIYQTADLFCYPSLAEKGESFGLAPLEAMATGLVPIVSDLDCFKDFITEGETGYFFNHRGENAPINLAKTLEAAIFNWQQTQKIAENAGHKAKYYSYENIAQMYLEQFKQILEK